MAGFPTFTPRTANTAAIWKDFNPAASFLGGMKAVRQMDLDQAAEERLRESAEVDRMVKSTMLPLDMEKARADIDLTMAQRAYALSRARNVADTAGAAALDFSGYSDDAINKIIGVPGSPVSNGASPASPNDVGVELDLGGGFFDSIDGRQSSGDFLSTAAEGFPNPATDLSEPNYAVSNSPDETSAFVNSGAAQLPQAGPQELSQIKALAKSGDKTAEQYLNPLSEFKTPQEKKNPLDDFDAAPESAIENTLKENANAFAGPRPQKKPQENEGGVGAYLVGQVGHLQSLPDRARGLKGLEKSKFLRAGDEFERRTYATTAKMLGLPPALGANATNALAYGTNGSQRSPKQIDEIVSLFKESQGTMDLMEAAAIVDGKSKQRIDAALGKGPAAGDPVKRIKDANDALKPLLDENGSPLPGKEAVVEFLYNDIDAASGAPTGAAAYSDRYSRLLDRERKLNLANANGVNFGDISKDSIPQELANLNEQKITLAIERAPTFNMTDPADKARMQDWLSKNETSSLPFNLILPDGAGTFEATGKENVYRRWSPIEKQWKIADFNKPQPAAASEATETNSEFSRAGQTGQKIRKAGGGLVRAVRGGSTSVGETLSNVPSSAVNMGAGIVEMGAGIFNVPLKIPRSLNITDSLKKMGLQRDEDGTWGSVKK